MSENPYSFGAYVERMARMTPAEREQERKRVAQITAEFQRFLAEYARQREE